MKITRIALWQLPLTSHVAYRMADGKSCETVETAVVRLDTDGGHAGWGEVCPIPHYLPAYARGVVPAIEDSWGSDIATAAALHLGAATKPDMVLNVCDLSGYVAPRLDPNGPTRQGGGIAPPEGPRLGLEIDADRLGEPVAVYS